MTPEEHNRAKVLVDKIQAERNHANFLTLVQELNEILKRKELRIVATANGPINKYSHH